MYFVFERLTGRRLNRSLAYIHFWLTVAGSLIIFWPGHFGHQPRRYIYYSDIYASGQIGAVELFIGIVALSVLLAQLLLPINLIYSLGRRRPRVGAPRDRPRS
ncbi:MAG TPA: hypothetical protein VL547_00385 [Dinghuibacter sp.]|uniref:hypothetical protein n=1 Tax=Dinghuibacter sp. TaxID=2024697 RepID=UPI002BC067B8|nr:hypothetical protein [Dinghuibacter sp.]HTJ10444.1 hypothetical protein [Dinghuibacter sp.]